MSLLISGPLIPRTKSAQGRSEKCSILILLRFGGIETKSVYLNWALSLIQKGWQGRRKYRLLSKKMDTSLPLSYQ